MELYTKTTDEMCFKIEYKILQHDREFLAEVKKKMGRIATVRVIRYMFPAINITDAVNIMDKI